MPYRQLDPARIINTAIVLERRIGERFPDAGIRKVCGELINLARDTRTEADRLAQPIWWLRGLVAMVIVAGALMFVFIGSFITFDRIDRVGLGIVEQVEASINTLVLAGLGLFALVRLEERIKRRAAMKGLHGMRSLIHVIDMHQLTKDPIAFASDFRPTASSPKRVLGRTDLKRYLDYCSEMLSLTGKVAALYAQAVNDRDVLEAVNDIENLSTNLSRKIWQKIMLIEPEALRRRRAA
ncbi:MAG: hypothetical protein BroJett030_20180 [Alphaproteobacteria bacterium]|nr:MAG: hypothetical protein BroJett030_20180 [Alphaproteobacteria bacterium]